jgi:hypothetical protein
VNSTISTTIPTVSRIQASVSNARVFAWLGVSLLILVGGILLAALPFIIPLDREVIEEIVDEAKAAAMDIGNDML